MNCILTHFLHQSFDDLHVYLVKVSLGKLSFKNIIIFKQLKLKVSLGYRLGQAQKLGLNSSNLNLMWRMRVWILP